MISFVFNDEQFKSEGKEGRRENVFGQSLKVRVAVIQKRGNSLGNERNVIFFGSFPPSSRKSTLSLVVIQISRTCNYSQFPSFAFGRVFFFYLLEHHVEDTKMINGEAIPNVRREKIPVLFLVDVLSRATS